MFGLIPLYFIGKYFSELAHEHNRSRWGFGILAIVVYIVSQLLFGLVLGIILYASDPDVVISRGMEMAVNVAGIVMGLVTVWLLYYLLKKAWEKKRLLQKDSQLLDDLG